MSYEKDILMHHGVKGQKWGIRKKKSYSTVISNLSDKDFVSNSKNAYRISDKKEKLSNSPTYVTLNKKDRANYIVGFSFFYDKMYSINMKTTSKMISPSERKRVEAFVDLYKNDPAVKKSLVKDSSKIHMVKSLLYKEKHFDKMYSKMDDAKLATKAYKDFAYDLTFNKDLANKYIDKFKAQGYNSLIDDHDALNNMSKNPLIVFDPAKYLKVSNYQTISDKDKREALKLIREKGVKHMDTTFGQDSIEHHGVKGMKWGQHKVTRLTGTNAGSKHKSSLGTYIQTRSANKARAKNWRSQYNNRGEMSTEDLRRAVNRLNLENQFDAATKQAMASSSQSVFSKYKQQYINGAVQGAVNTTNQVGNRVGQAAATAMIKKLGVAAAASV